MHPPIIDWQQSLREAYRSPAELLRDLDIAPQSLDWLERPEDGFRMLVPRGFARRMERGNPRDPLLLQVLPRRRENEAVPGFVSDPLAEAGAQASPGLIQKYAGRALLITTGACAVHCRYCFRRAFPYADAHAARQNWGPALQALRDDTSIGEIILSGGDPLSLSDERLGQLIRQLDSITHLHTLRIHTRQPVVLPERVTADLAAQLQGSRLRTLVVIHSNHPNELDDSVDQALMRLRRSGALLLNQAVLLAGINDEIGIQARLSRRLFECGVLPYYLHLLDPVSGAAHFALADSAAHGIMQGLNAILPGYLVPRLVREVPGDPGKRPACWQP